MSQKLIYPTSQNFVQKNLAALLGAGVTAAATLNNVTGIQNKKGVMIVDRLDTNDVETPNKREVIVFEGTSGSTVVTLTRNADGSGTDQEHAIGAIVEFGPDIMWAQAVIDGLSEVVDPSTGVLDTTKVVTPAGTQTLTNKTLTTPKIATLYQDSIGGSNLLTMPAATDTLVGKATTDTLTNKRVTPRAGTVTSHATPTINTDTTDFFTITALAADITSMTSSLSGTPTIGQKLVIRIKDDGTSRAITWGASFASRGATLPTATTISKTHYVGLIWNGVTSTWDCVAATVEA